MSDYPFWSLLVFSLLLPSLRLTCPLQVLPPHLAPPQVLPLQLHPAGRAHQHPCPVSSLANQTTARCVFLIPAESGEKITLGISTMLNMTVFLMTVTSGIPPTDQTPILSRCPLAAPPHHPRHVLRHGDGPHHRGHRPRRHRPQDPPPGQEGHPRPPLPQDHRAVGQHPQHQHPQHQHPHSLHII